MKIAIKAKQILSEYSNLINQYEGNNSPYELEKVLMELDYPIGCMKRECKGMTLTESVNKCTMILRNYGITI